MRRSPGSVRLLSRNCARPATWSRRSASMRRRSRRLLCFAEERGGIYTPGAGCAVRVDDGQSADWPVQRAAQVRLTAGWSACSTRTCVPAGWICRFANAAVGAPRPGSGGFAALDAAWEADMGWPWSGAGHPRRVRPGGARLPGVPGITRGRLTSDDADGASVLGFLESLSGRWATSSLFWVVSNFRPFLKFTGRADLVGAAGLAGVRRSHAILPVLCDEDERLVVQACASGAVSARDAAITLLALTTGLRACDIIALRLGDVDWRGQDDRDRAAKDGQPADVAADRHWCWASSPATCSTSGPARPMITCSCARLAPHTRLAGHASVHRVITETFRKAGSGRCEGREPVPASQRRVQAAARGGPAADDLGRARPRQPGIDQRCI